MSENVEKEPSVIFKVEDGVAWIIFNRPEARNALNMEMRGIYFKALEQCAEDHAIRAVVLTANGKGFCTGADLSGSRAAKGDDGPPHPGATRNAMGSSVKTLRALWDLEKPIICAVNGVAAGLGAHLAWACDLVIAAEEAKFIEIFVRRGIAVDALGGFLLPRLIGLHKAKELTFFGDDLSAVEAEKLGLVNRVVPGAQLEEETRKWAKRLAEGPTFAIGLSKRLLNRSLQTDIEGFAAEEAFTQALVANSEDMKEGIRSFMEKRAPAFKGR